MTKVALLSDVAKKRFQREFRSNPTIARAVVANVYSMVLNAAQISPELTLKRIKAEVEIYFEGGPVAIADEEVPKWADTLMEAGKDFVEFSTMNLANQGLLEDEDPIEPTLSEADLKSYRAGQLVFQHMSETDGEAGARLTYEESSLRDFLHEMDEDAYADMDMSVLLKEMVDSGILLDVGHGLYQLPTVNALVSQEP